MHSSHMLREGARLEVVRDNMGHANIDVTPNVYGKKAVGPRLRDRKAEDLGCPTSRALGGVGAYKTEAKP